MRRTQANDRRIAKIMTQGSRFSSGDDRNNLDISEKLDEIDAISAGLNPPRDSIHTRPTPLLSCACSRPMDLTFHNPDVKQRLTDVVIKARAIAL